MDSLLGNFAKIFATSVVYCITVKTVVQIMLEFSELLGFNASHLDSTSCCFLLVVYALHQ